jgi:hypothetical protein
VLLPIVPRSASPAMPITSSCGNAPSTPANCRAEQPDDRVEAARGHRSRVPPSRVGMGLAADADRRGYRGEVEREPAERARTVVATPVVVTIGEIDGR